MGARRKKSWKSGSNHRALVLTYHAFSAVFFREASFNIVVHCCESVGDAGCLDENKEGGGPLPSSPHFSSSSTKTRPTQGKGKNVAVEKRGENKEGGVVSSTKTRQSRSLDLDHTQQKHCPPQSFFSAFAKTKMQVEQLSCPINKGFNLPFPP